MFKKILNAIAVFALVVCSIVIAYGLAFNIFMSTYTEFCNIQGRQWDQSLDITSPTYRLGGIGNIGIGSTKEQVVRAVNRRNALGLVFDPDTPRSRYFFLETPLHLPESTLGFYRVRTWNAIEFLFDERDRVTKIRITPMG